MKNCFTLLLLFVFTGVYAQDVKVLRGSLPVAKVINLSNPALKNWAVDIHNIREAPKHTDELTEKKAMLARMRNQYKSSHQTKQLQATPPVPVIIDSFAGNPPQASTPPDNTMAISNAGIIVSCVNTQLMVFDTNGNQLLSNSLTTFANQLGFYNGISDPRVIYDAAADRFIVLFFSGSSSVNSQIIVAFSETNDPTTFWSFYALSGNLLNDTTWSDYPVVSVTQDDFFVTFNHLKDGYGWKDGFRYSVIWQIDKQRGYNADTIKYNYWHNINYKGKAIWNISTVQGGSAPSGPDAYFLSVRPSDVVNDTVFLHHITNSYVSGVAQFSTQVLKTAIGYGLSPNARQVNGKQLATNDSRVLSAFIENDNIQFVQNCINPHFGMPGLYIGSITSVSSLPVATGQFIGFDSIALGYPSIAYIGNGVADNRAIVTCSYLPASGYPGTAAFYLDNSGTPSNMLSIKEGASAVNMLLDSVERWGDYTAIQKRYNVPNTAWLSGSYTNASQQYQTWIAALGNTDVQGVGIVPAPAAKTAKVYPNPTTNLFTVTFDLASQAYCRFTLIDAQGKEVRLLLEDNIDAGTNSFSFSTAYLAAGVYYLHINAAGNNILTRKLVVE